MIDTSSDILYGYDASITSLLFQTGYLTIKGYDEEWRLYKLGIPNREVEEGPFEGMLNIIRENRGQDNLSFIRKLVITLREGQASPSRNIT